MSTILALEPYYEKITNRQDFPRVTLKGIITLDLLFAIRLITTIIIFALRLVQIFTFQALIEFTEIKPMK